MKMTFKNIFLNSFCLLIIVTITIIHCSVLSGFNYDKYINSFGNKVNAPDGQKFFEKPRYNREDADQFFEIHQYNRDISHINSDTGRRHDENSEDTLYPQNRIESNFRMPNRRTRQPNSDLIVRYRNEFVDDRESQIKIQHYTEGHVTDDDKAMTVYLSIH